MVSRTLLPLYAHEQSEYSTPITYPFSPDVRFAEREEKVQCVMVGVIPPGWLVKEGDKEGVADGGASVAQVSEKS